MKKGTILLLISAFIGVCVLLFSAFYYEAKKTAVKRLNEEQMIHAKQAAHGIEEFFRTWTAILTSLARMDEIVNNTIDGKRYMKLFCEAHRDQIKSITRVDPKGTIMFTFPYGSSVGTNISNQRHVQEILNEHKPVVSDVFGAVQGFDAVALHVPVFKGASFEGTIAIVINFESLARRYLEVIQIGETGYAWVISRDGTELYSPVPGFTGKTVFENCKDFPSIISMAQDMLQGHQGTTTYTFDQIRNQKVVPVKKHAVYLPIHIGSTFWSIAVASSEEEVLSTLYSFRNRLILIIGVLFTGGILFFILGARAWFIVAEEEKRKRVEEELRASEQRYRHLFEQNPATMLIYERGTMKILAVNSAFTKQYGYSSEKALSLRLTDLYPEDEKDRIVERAAGLKGLAYVGEWHHLKSDGSIITIVAQSHDIDYWGHDARIAVISDVTERKQMENALRQSEERFFKAFHATPDSIVISRAADRLLLEVNEAFVAQSEYSRDEVLNRTAEALRLWVDPADRERYGATVRDQGRVRDMEARFRTKSGKILDGLVSGESIVLSNELCLLTIIRNITERKKTEAELEKHRHHLEDMVRARTEELEQSQKALQHLLDDMSKARIELESANERLKELDRLKSAFLATMSHELRTPLNSIIGFTGILRQGLAGPLNDEQRKQLGMVQNSAHHLLELINDILDISKIEAGQLEMARDTFDLRKSLDKVVHLVSPMAEKKSLPICLHVTDTIGTFEGDQRRVEQILINLLNNAIKFTETGEIGVSCSVQDPNLIISVSDTGIGIKPEDMETIFKPFRQIDTGLARRYEGTGLGLSITKRLVTMMGGDIRVKSKEGVGSTFSVILPIC